jgi:hypothetical protein
MMGPKRSVTQKELDDNDVSTKDTGNEQKMLDEKRKEFMGGDDDNLRDKGFLDDDEKIDFSNFKIGKKETTQEDQEQEVQSIFGRLTSAF